MSTSQYQKYANKSLILRLLKFTDVIDATAASKAFIFFNLFICFIWLTFCGNLGMSCLFSSVNEVC